MHIKLLISAAAIALVAGIASATAEEPFTSLEGVLVEELTREQLAGVAGVGTILADRIADRTSDAIFNSGSEAANGILVATSVGPAEGVDIFPVLFFNPSP